MKLIIAAAAAATSLLAMAAPAAAQDLQGSIGYTTTHDDSGFEPTAITARIGWKSASAWGIEGEASFGSSSDTIGLTTVDIDSQVGVYLTGALPVNDQFEFLARIGYATNRISASGGGATNFTDESFNYGVGAQWWFSGPNGVRLDYTRIDYQGAGNGKSDAWTLSYVRKFGG